MDDARTQMLRELLATTGWVERTGAFAMNLQRPAEPGSLLLIGTPDEEPWHLAAHLDDEARFSGLPQLSPTLVRWAPPRGAPEHLSIGLQRVEVARRGETIFVVAPSLTPDSLLERIADARQVGATILAMDTGDDELGDLAHDRLLVPPSDPAGLPLTVPESSGQHVDLEVIQHLVSMSAGERTTRVSARNRLARLLERISGPAPQR